MSAPHQDSGSDTGLAPCPFCGGEASATGVIRYDAKHEAFWSDGSRVLEAFFCNCLRCGIDNKGLLGHQTREKAIAAWNRRPTPAAPESDDPEKHPDFYTWTWDVWVSGGNWRAEYGWKKPAGNVTNLRPLFKHPKDSPTAPAAEDGSSDASYPEGFDASCGLSAHAMRTANGLMTSVIGKREWDVLMVAAALESFARHAAAELAKRQEKNDA